MDESTIDDPSAPGPRGLDFDATSASVLGGLFGSQARPRVGRYEVLRPLGAGAMGRVFAARDVSLDRDVALKLLHVERGRDTTARARFLREARALARVSHPNVVEVFEVGVHEGDVYIAMELLQGQTLRAWMDARPRTWRESLAILEQVGEGLAAAHRVGLVHRDVKPANVWVAGDGRARVIDFGLAVTDVEVALDTERSNPRVPEALEASESKLTRTGAMVGSPAYMAPEQMMHGRASEASDQFSFCVTAFEALHGQRPFPGRTLFELVEAIQRGSVVRTDDETPRWIDAVLMRGLQAEIGSRWRSMDGLLAALRRGPRRRWAGAGAVALVGVVGAIALPVTPGEGCAGHQLSAWGPEARAALRDVGGTAETFERSIAGPVDRWAEQWSQQHAAACEAGPSSEGFDRTMHCLDVARERFEEMAEVLSTLPPGRVEEATSLASGIARLPLCAGEPLVADDEAFVASSRADALTKAGRYGEALGVARLALDDVEHPAARIELLRVAASAARDAGRMSDAVSLGEQGYFLALREGHDAEAAELVVIIVAALGSMAELQAARRWYELGAAMVDRAPEPVALRGNLDESLGVALFNAGRPEEAVEMYERALDALPPDDPVKRASLHGDRGNALLDAGRLKEGRAALGRSLQAMRRAYGPDHPAVGIVETNLGTDHAMSGAFEDARPHFVEALRIARVSGEPRNLGLALGNMGLMAHSVDAHGEAQRFLQQALEQFEIVGGPSSPMVLNTLQHLALNAQARGDLEGAERQFWSMLERQRETFGPDHVALASTYDAIGQNFVQQGRYVEAEPNFRESLRIFESEHGPQHPKVVFPLLGLGRCASEVGRHDDALRSYRRALALSARDEAGPDLLHDARLGLARALRKAGADEAEVRTLLEAARVAANARQDAKALQAVEALYSAK